MARILISMTFILMAAAASAQEATETFTFGADSFLAGADVTHETAGTDDLFMAGETVEAKAAISGSAHAVGRRVSLDASIAQDVYAVGMDIILTGSVEGDATLAGYEIVLGGDLGGDLRASGAKITLDGSVGGYGLIAGEAVVLNSTIAGDVSLAAERATFGADARIDGQLTIYEEKSGNIQVPEFVIPETRITREIVENLSRDGGRVVGLFNWRRALTSFVTGVLIVAAIAALIAAVAPAPLAMMRQSILEKPFRTLWVGFLTQSAVVGSAILFALTVIGIFLAPAAILLALIGGFFGYVVGAYSFGVGLLLAFGRDEPEELGQRVLAAGIGALLVGLLGLVPLLGWIFVLTLTLAGVGAITARVFRPAFFSGS